MTFLFHRACVAAGLSRCSALVAPTLLTSSGGRLVLLLYRPPSAAGVCGVRQPRCAPLLRAIHLLSQNEALFSLLRRLSPVFATLTESARFLRNSFSLTALFSVWLFRSSALFFTLKQISPVFATLTKSKGG